MWPLDTLYTDACVSSAMYPIICRRSKFAGLPPLPGPRPTDSLLPGGGAYIAHNPEHSVHIASPTGGALWRVLPGATSAAARRRGGQPAPQTAAAGGFTHADRSAFLRAQGASAAVEVLQDGAQDADDQGRGQGDKGLLHGLPPDVAVVFKAAADKGLRPEALSAAVQRYRSIVAAGQAALATPKARSSKKQRV